MRVSLPYAGLMLLTLVGGCAPTSEPPADAANATTAPAVVEFGTEVADIEAKPAAAATGDALAINAAKSEIDFVGTKDDGSHAGGFKEFAGQIGLDDAGQIGRVQLEIVTDSIWSDDEKLTAHLKSPDFFEVKAYPTATFVSTNIELGDDGAVVITGDLTLHGVTKSISLPAMATVNDESVALSAQFPINRNDFGITYGAGKIHDDVAITAALQADRP